MLGLLLNKTPDSVLHVLCLGAHSDDIEIGCGGTILRLIDEYPDLEITWIVFGARDIRATEAQMSAEAFLKGVRNKQIIVKAFQDGYFPYVGGEIKDYFEQLKHDMSPELIFTHYRHDLHQDHRLVNELTWNTFRDHLILEYEIPKFDGDFGSPNVFIFLNETISTRKIKYILGNFKSQRDKNWFTEDAFWSVMRLRGIESRARFKYAEGFYGRKLLFWEQQN